jgi:outer membrane lipoprotein-sorting protein
MRRPVSLTAVLGLLFLAGCREDARGLLDSMHRRYRDAATYADEAIVQVTYTRGDATTERTFPFQVAFTRPDRLRIDAYDARIASDGSRLRAAVGAAPGQVLVEEVKSPLSLDQLFADPELAATLAEGEAGCPTQLPLLLADDTVELILADATAPPRISGRASIEGHVCDRVEIRKPDGLLELWIDRGSRLLRRMRVPTDAYAAELSRRDGPTGVSVVVDFRAASFDRVVPATAFTFEQPPGAAEVSRLDPPRPPVEPHPRIGKPAGSLQLQLADGGPVGPTETPIVLEFFFVGCKPSTRTMPQVATGIAAFARKAGVQRPVRHLAVSVDEADVESRDLGRALAEFGGVGELARDPRGVAAEALGIDSFPAVVILAADGTIADVQQGEHGRLAHDVEEMLAAVAAGKDTTALVRERYRSRLEAYRTQLANLTDGGILARLPEQVIAPRRQPDRFKLVPVWRADGVALPGNLVCLDEARGHSGPPRIVALDGWRTVVEIAVDGTESGRHELPLPEDAAVGFLRTAVDREGRRWWLGSARGGQHLFVFDQAWKLHATYPEPGGAIHDGISAATFADLEADGIPEVVVGYFGTVGLQAASLDGRRLWRTRELGTILDVAVDDAPLDATDRGLLCVLGDGRIVSVTMAGRPGEPRQVGDWRLRSLAAGPVAADGGRATVALAGTAVGKTTAVGVSADREPLWELPLPDGVHRDGPIEPLAWADLLGGSRRQWLIAGPDGSVTIAWADGRVVDRYRHGAALVGLGGFRVGETGHLVLATATGLQCLRVTDVALD